MSTTGITSRAPRARTQSIRALRLLVVGLVVGAVLLGCAAKTSRSSPTSSPESACFEGFSGCLGPLAAGAYTAPGFGIDFTVPDGWTNLVDNRGWFLLSPRDDSARGKGTGKYLAVFPDALIASDSRACPPEPLAGVGHTVDDIVAYLTQHEGLATSNLTAVTIGGLAGKSLDLSLAPSWTTTCSGESEPSVSYLTENNAEGWRWGVDGSEHQRMAFLDEGAGGVIVVAISSPTGEGFDALAQAAAPIVESFAFHRGSGSSSSSPTPSP